MKSILIQRSRSDLLYAI